MHSTISAFYGVDAIPVIGLSGVEVKRGAGQALMAPESIGGVLNLLTVNPQKKASRYLQSMEVMVRSSPVSLQAARSSSLRPNEDSWKPGILTTTILGNRHTADRKLIA